MSIFPVPNMVDQLSTGSGPTKLNADTEQLKHNKKDPLHISELH